MERRRPWSPDKVREACLAASMLPVEDVVEMLYGKGKTAAYAWANRPDCPCRIDRSGRPWMVPSVDVLAMVESNHNPNSAAGGRPIPPATETSTAKETDVYGSNSTRRPRAV